MLPQSDTGLSHQGLPESNSQLIISRASLSEHARWTVIVPALLRCWLEIPYSLSRNPNDFTATETITRTFAAVARSTSMLMTNKPIDRLGLLSVVKRARNEVQVLLKVAASAANINPRSRSVTRIRSSEV